MNDSKSTQVGKIALAALVAGAVVGVQAQASTLTVLGSGHQIRNSLAQSNNSFAKSFNPSEADTKSGSEGKCGEGKCGDMDMGDDEPTPSPTTGK